jgi:hypothetical protein
LKLNDLKIQTQLTLNEQILDSGRENGAT